MLATPTRDRLVGATLLGAIWTVLSTGVVCGFNPIGGSLHDLGAFAQGAILLLLGFVWIGLFYGILTWWAQRLR